MQNIGRYQQRVLSEIMIFDAVLVKHLGSLYVVRTTPDSEDLQGQQTMCFWLIRMCLITDSFHEAPLSYRSRLGFGLIREISLFQTSSWWKILHWGMEEIQALQYTGVTFIFKLCSKWFLT